MHLNGYKISQPHCLRPHVPRGGGARSSWAAAGSPASSRATIRCRHAREAGRAAMDWAIRGDPATSRNTPRTGRARRRATSSWPMIVLRSPKGWTGPKVVDGKPIEGSFRAHQVPLDPWTVGPPRST
ncbi:hypothetical protein [Gemmiger sp.]|uniref:hypothetical protein n=1 Tax=Gemmiger sp. TaxID=2049027 RepID=UPI003522F32E